MNVEALHQFVASVPGTFGQLFTRRMAVDLIAGGRVEASIVLIDLARLDTIPALINAGASPP